MKKSELRDIIKEELYKEQRKPLVESLVPFNKVKSLVYNEILALYKQMDPDVDHETTLKADFKKIKTVDKLLNAMAERGFDNVEEELLSWIIK